MPVVKLDEPMIARLEAALEKGAYEPVGEVLSAVEAADRDLIAYRWLWARVCFFRGDWTQAGLEYSRLRRARALEVDAWFELLRTAAASGNDDWTLRILADAPAGAESRTIFAAKLYAALSLGRLSEVEPLLSVESTAAGALKQLARNILSLRSRQPELAEKLARSRPWDLAYLETFSGEPVPFLRTGREPVPFYDPGEKHRLEAEALAACERDINIRVPLLILGVGTGRVLSEIFKAPAAVGKRLAAVVVVEDWRLLALRLTAADWTAAFDAGVFHFLGPDARELDQYLRADRRRVPLTGRFAVCDCIGDESSGGYLRRVDSILDELSAECTARLSASSKYYASEEFLHRWREPGRLKIAIQTCRYTTFIYSSTLHLKEAFEKQGCDVEIWCEEDEPQQWVGPWYVAERLSAFRPDLLLRINFLRQETETPIPAGLPFLTWVQDYCPSHLDKGRIEKLHARDYIAGISKTNLVDVGYPAARCLLSPVPSPASVYFAPARGGREYRYEASYVSHQSSPPAAWCERFFRSGRSPQEVRFVEHVYNRLCAEYAAGRIIYSVHLQLGADFINASVACPWPAWVSLYAMQLTNLFFRHAILEWVAQTGVELSLFGDGWEKHPTLARFARGPVRNGTPLLELYRASAVNLQLMATGNLHQRLVDGFLAGGFFLMPRLNAYRPQLAVLDRPVHERLLRTLAEEDFTTFDELAAREPDLARYLHEAGERSTFEQFLTAGAGDDRAFSAAEQDLVSDASLRFPTIERVQFADRNELKTQLEYWLARPSEREAFVAAIQTSGALESFTAEFQTKRLVRWLRRRVPSDGV